MIEITSTTLANIEETLALIRDYYEYDGISFDSGSARRALETLILDGTLGGAWLIKRDSHTAGYFVLTFGFDIEFGGRQATLTDIYIAPPFRRTGLGRAAIEFIDGFLASRGVGALELQVERDNHEALAFYRRLGSETHDRIPLSRRVPIASDP